jgi:hypothetical protein
MFDEHVWGGCVAQSIAARALWNGYVVTFDGAISEDEAEGYFFPNGVPDGIEVTMHGHEVGITHHSGVLAVRAKLWPDLQRWLDAAEQAPSDAWKPGDPETTPTPVGPGKGGGWDLTDPDQYAKARKYLEEVADGAHRVASAGEIACFFIGEAAFAAEMVFGVVGSVATLTVAFVGLYEAFQAGLKEQAQLGTCYGLMWGACDVPPEQKVFKDAIAGDSAAEREEAFSRGVQLAIADGKVTATRNKILLMVAGYLLRGWGDAGRTPDDGMVWAAQHQVLNDLGSAIVYIKPTDMKWPKPEDDWG